MRVTEEINSIHGSIEKKGFAIADNIYTDREVEALLLKIANADKDRPTFRQTNDLFAIRQFFKEVPGVAEIVFNSKLKEIINQVYGEDFFVVKSIYFDKPGNSNWFVAYHQDLTISVDKKSEMQGYGPWTIKQQQFAVQPPLNILEDNFTIRIHLDDTNEDNGALRVIPASHLRGIYRPDAIDWTTESEVYCNVAKGGIMFMKPLLLHASSRSINDKKRRVLHIEFSRHQLPAPLKWAEYMQFDK